MAVEEKIENVMSYDEALYLDIGAEAPDIQVMNVGVTKFDENSNPTEKEKQYIGQKSKTTTVTGFNNVFDIESDLIKNDKVIQDLYGIFRMRKTGADAQRTLYIVELWNPVSMKENTFKARKILTSAIIAGKTATPGEEITFNGTLKGMGDFVDGEFNISTKTFEATV